MKHFRYWGMCTVSTPYGQKKVNFSSNLALLILQIKHLFVCLSSIPFPLRLPSTKCVVWCLPFNLVGFCYYYQSCKSVFLCINSCDLRGFPLEMELAQVWPILWHHVTSKHMLGCIHRCPGMHVACAPQVACACYNSQVLIFPVFPTVSVLISIFDACHFPTALMSLNFF